MSLTKEKRLAEVLRGMTYFDCAECLTHNNGTKPVPICCLGGGLIMDQICQNFRESKRRGTSGQ